MAVKVVFIGNSLGGDDGIGPFLYNELKDESRLKDFEMLELGVIGFDLIAYIEDDDKLIIVDAVHTDNPVGEVILLEEDDLKADLSIVSQHDFGIEQTSKVLRLAKPGLKKINVVGVSVKNISFVDKLSDEIMGKIDKIKEDVIDNIVKIGEI